MVGARVCEKQSENKICHPTWSMQLPDFGKLTNVLIRKPSMVIMMDKIHQIKSIESNVDI